MAADNPSLALYESLNTYAQVQALIDQGIAEHGHLECKAPSSPQLDRGLQAHLATALSGFANAGGGVILWGVVTNRNETTAQDVLTQIQPIGNCRKLANEIDRQIPLLTVPVVRTAESRVLHEKKGDTKGVVVTHLPAAVGDPIRTLTDDQFYLRANDQFVVMPYDLVKRMFSSVAQVDLQPVFDHRLVKRDAAGIWNIPIWLGNSSSTAPEHGKIIVEVLNPGACANVASEEMRDCSSVNPGKCIFIHDLETPIYRGLNAAAGGLLVTMKTGKQPKRVVRIKITVHAERMRAREWVMRVQLAKKGFSVTKESEAYLY